MTSQKQRAAQVAAGNKAAATKAANAAKAKAAALINTPGLENRTEVAATASIHNHDSQHVHAARAPPDFRLLTKREILDLTGVSFVTIWTWMRAGKFPRSREVGGRSMWFSTEVENWLNGLPVRKLKGDNGAAISA
jgi:predicted DNA-binding transcriptional regulator AlpA